MGQASSLLASPNLQLRTWSTKYCGGALLQSYRQTMEDFEFHQENFIFPSWTVVGVLDGHGGSDAAKFVKQHFLSTFSKYLRDDFAYEFEEVLEPNTEEIQKAFTKTFFEIDKLYRSVDKDSSGACCTVCLITNTHIVTAWCGDCAASIIKNDFHKYMLTTEHNPDVENEKQRILNADFNIYNGRIDGCLNVSRAFGDFFLKPIERERIVIKDGKKRSMEKIKLSETTFPVTVQPEISIYKRQSDDFMLCVCSDGVTKMFDNWNQSIEVVYNQGCRLPHQFSTFIVDDCVKRKILDNSTMSIWINPSHNFPIAASFDSAYEKYKEERKILLKPCSCSNIELCENCQATDEEDIHYTG